MTPSDLAPLGSQQVEKHPRPCEGELQVQQVDLLHEGEVFGRERARQVVHRAVRDADDLGCLEKLNA